MEDTVLKADGTRVPTTEELEQQARIDKMQGFLNDTKERFDKYFGELGYTCFVFDKTNQENKYLSNISNCATKDYMMRLLPFLHSYRKSIKKLVQNIKRLK